MHLLLHCGYQATYAIIFPKPATLLLNILAWCPPNELIPGTFEVSVLVATEGSCYSNREIESIIERRQIKLPNIVYVQIFAGRYF